MDQVGVLLTGSRTRGPHGGLDETDMATLSRDLMLNVLVRFLIQLLSTPLKDTYMGMKRETSKKGKKIIINPLINLVMRSGGDNMFPKLFTQMIPDCGRILKT